MSYVQGGKIEASDFNTFRSRVINILGTGSGDSGYGQETLVNTIPQVEKDVDKITSVEWKALLSAINKVAAHQNTVTPLPSEGDFDTGTPITREIIEDAISQIELYKLNVDANDTATIANSAIITRNTSWNTVIDCELKVGFPNSDAGRWFFNTGGRISFELGHPNTGGHQVQDDVWRSVFSQVGTLFIDSYKYYALTETYSLIYNGINVGSAYVGYSLYNNLAMYGYNGYTSFNDNDLYVYARKDTDGNVYVKIEIVDSFTTPDIDTVASGTNVIFSTRLMSGAVSQLSPTLHSGVNIFTPATDITYTILNNF